jgi:hypothetical protein
MIFFQPQFDLSPEVLVWSARLVRNLLIPHIGGAFCHRLGDTTHQVFYVFSL